MTAGRGHFDIDVCCALLRDRWCSDDNVVPDIVLPALVEDESNAILAVGVQ